MAHVDAPLRPATATGWLAFAAGLLAGAELLYQWQVYNFIYVFGRRIPPGAAVLGAVLTLALTVWGLASVLAAWRWSGCVMIDPASGEMILRRGGLHGNRETRGPVSQWRVRLVFYGPAHRRDGVFRRIEIAGPQKARQVILFKDVREPSILVDGLRQASSQFEEFEEHLISEV